MKLYPGLLLKLFPWFLLEFLQQFLVQILTRYFIGFSRDFSKELFLEFVEVYWSFWIFEFFRSCSNDPFQRFPRNGFKGPSEIFRWSFREFWELPLGFLPEFLLRFPQEFFRNATWDFFLRFSGSPFRRPLINILQIPTKICLSVFPGNRFT